MQTSADFSNMHKAPKRLKKPLSGVFKLFGFGSVRMVTNSPAENRLLYYSEKFCVCQGAIKPIFSRASVTSTYIYSDPSEKSGVPVSRAYATAAATASSTVSCALASTPALR